MKKYFLVLDIGTSGIKALLFTKELEAIARSHRDIQRFYPKKDFVEQDPFELVEASRHVIKQVVEESRIDVSEVIAIGITNQRETTILWDKTTGKPVYPAIGWEDERTESESKNLQKYAPKVREKTGLPITPYFSATKIAWILKHVPKAEELLASNQLLFGTVDSWVLWNLSKEKAHATDVTNASRTLVFNIQTRKWDDALVNIFSVPKEILPPTFPTQYKFGTLKKDIIGRDIPISVICGDQQSSMYAVGTEKGTTKVTYGTGTFILQSVGKKFSIHKDFFTTIIPIKNGVGYALEAKIDNSGKNVAESLANKKKLDKVIVTLTTETAKLIKELPILPNMVIVDGGITREESLVQKQQALLGIPVEKNTIFDGTALGVAKLLQEYYL